MSKLAGSLTGAHAARANNSDFHEGPPLVVLSARRAFRLRFNRALVEGCLTKIAFDHENGDIIMETILAAEICRAAKDIDRELFRRPRFSNGRMH